MTMMAGFCPFELADTFYLVGMGAAGEDKRNSKKSGE